MHYVMNDYELVYLIQYENDEHALDFMFKKYHKFIWKNVHLLDLEKKEEEDFFQEGMLMLHKAVMTFNPSKNKSFTRYFELILKRQYYTLRRTLPAYYLFDHTDYCKGACYIEEEPITLDLKSELEQIVYEQYFLQSVPIATIAETSPYNKKQIYNTIYRIKEKYKMMV